MTTTRHEQQNKEEKGNIKDRRETQERKEKERKREEEGPRKGDGEEEEKRKQICHLTEEHVCIDLPSECHQSLPSLATGWLQF